MQQIQKRLVTVEIISQGEQPVDLDAAVQNAIIAGVHHAVAKTLNLNYTNAQGNTRRHTFVGVSIKEIK